MNVTAQTVLFTGYAAMLLLGACALDRFARHSRIRSDRYRDDHDTPPWPHSEADRFRRGLVLLPVGLAILLLVVLVLQHHQPGDVAVISVPLLASGLLGYRFTRRFRRTSHGFPVTTRADAARAGAARHPHSRS